MADTDLLDYAGLKSYDSKIKSFMHNRQMTKSAPAVQFCPAPESELEPVVDFLFTETPPASGDKGPDNPSTITGVSSVNVGRIGKNLLFNAVGPSSYYSLTRNTDGSLTVSGSGAILVAVTDSGAGTSGPYSAYRLNMGKQYTLSVELVSGTINNANINLAQSSENQKIVTVPASGRASISFTPSTSSFVDGRFVCRLLTNTSTVATNAVLKIQLEEGSTATDFEAPMLPADANNTIPLNGTYYGGSIDPATGTMTVTHVAVTPDASTVDISSAPAALPLDYADTFGRAIASADGTSLSVGSSGGTVVYKLATPQTVQLTPTQIRSLPALDKYEPRINTVYTDQEAVRVGWQRMDIDSILARLDAIEAQLDG